MNATYTKNGDSFREFEGDFYRVNDKGTGLNETILKRSLDQLSAMKAHHSKLLIYMFIPLPSKSVSDNKIMSQFVEKLNRELARIYNINRVAYLWVSEVSNRGNAHYHFCLIINAHKAQSYTNLKSIVVNTWLKVGGQKWELQDGKQLRPLGIMKNDIYKLKRNDKDMLEEIIYRLSYFAKNNTKAIGKGRTFGVSRIKPPCKKS